MQILRSKGGKRPALSRSVFALTLTIALLFTIAGVHAIQATPADSGGRTQQTSEADVDAVWEQDFFSGLPVADVNRHQTNDSRGTVVLIPQYHQTPDAISEPGANRRAARTQQETVPIINHLMTAGVETVFVEGEPEHQTATTRDVGYATELTKLSDRFEDNLDRFRSELDENAPASVVERVSEHGNEALTRTERKVQLMGAPLAIKARGSNLTVIGTENEALLEESRHLIQHRYFLRDRLARVTPANAVQTNASTTSDGADASSTRKLISLLEESEESSSFPHLLSRLENDPAVSGNDSRKRIIQQLRRQWTLLQMPQPAEPASADSPDSAELPDRDNNPYSHITDPAKLRNLKEQNEQQLQNVVVDERDQHTAEVVTSSMEKRDLSVAMLQFGAGHTEGLTQQLRHHGFSVVVVTPDTVGRD